MGLQSIFDAVILGIVEGITEFIPVSSTAHLLLSTELLGLGNGGEKAFWDTFSVLIQLGAILAVVVAYFGRLWGVLVALPRGDARAWRFVASIVVAFLPSAVVGLLLHDFIKEVLFNSPALICVVLIVGGVALAALDRYDVDPVHGDAMRFPLWLAFAIGLFQCLAIVPGVSRSGATIAGALLLKCKKGSAAEFSFFLAIPTMLGAFVLDFYENASALSGGDIGLIAIGFVVSFVSALFVVKTLIGFVARHGFTPFGWWRVIVGVVGLGGLYLAG